MAHPILGESTVSSLTAYNWAKSHKASTAFQHLTGYYWTYAVQRGVRPEVGYAQAAHETGFGHFGGHDPVFSADESFKNVCGMKNKNATATQKFPTWAVGVIAHLDHLALYAGALSYPRHDTPDVRHFPDLFGKATTFEALGKLWAPGFDYSNAIEYLDGLLKWKA